MGTPLRLAPWLPDDELPVGFGIKLGTAAKTNLRHFDAVGQPYNRHHTCVADRVWLAGVRRLCNACFS